MLALPDYPLPEEIIYDAGMEKYRNTLEHMSNEDLLKEKTTFSRVCEQSHVPFRERHSRTVLLEWEIYRRGNSINNGTGGLKDNTKNFIASLLK